VLKSKLNNVYHICLQKAEEIKGGRCFSGSKSSIIIILYSNLLKIDLRTGTWATNPCPFIGVEDTPEKQQLQNIPDGEVLQNNDRVLVLLNLIQEQLPPDIPQHKMVSIIIYILTYFRIVLHLTHKPPVH
jgi:hypothetical protein